MVDKRIAKYQYCVKHFVALNWFDDAAMAITGKMRFLCTSGFILSFADRWFYATAGHILDQIRINRLERNVTVRSMGLMDHGGIEAKFTDAIPFSFVDDEAIVFFDEDRGIDFGFLELSQNTRQLLEANNVSAVGENHWDRDDEFEAVEYFVLGCPTSQQVLFGGLTEEGSTLEGHANIVIMPVERLSEEEQPQTKVTHRFFGRMKDKMVVSIDGFSGGPVFAFGPKREDGRVPYRVIGMQHSWHEQKRVIRANWLKTIGVTFREHLSSK